MNRLVILGAGGFAREAFLWAIDHCRVEAFYSNLGPVEDDMFGVPVIRDLDGLKGTPFLSAVGDPKIRMLLWEKAEQAGLVPCEPIVHRTAVIGPQVHLARGSIICPNAVLTTSINASRGLLVNLGATIGHDCMIGEFVTIAPGANISGDVYIGSRTSIGTNACVREGIDIDSDCTVGMGAVVVKDIVGGSVVIGNPARQRTPK